MLKFLFLDSDDSKHLTFETLCAALGCKITFDTAISDKDKFDVVFLPSDLQLTKDLLKAKNLPGTIFLYGNDAKINAAMQKLILHENLSSRLVTIEFASGDTSSFGQAVKSLL